MRPSTEGCTEFSCLYHGRENQFKATHDHTCPIRTDDGFVSEASNDPRGYISPECTCHEKEEHR